MSLGLKVILQNSIEKEFSEKKYFSEIKIFLNLFGVFN